MRGKNLDALSDVMSNVDARWRRPARCCLQTGGGDDGGVERLCWNHLEFKELSVLIQLRIQLASGKCVWPGEDGDGNRNWLRQCAAGNHDTGVCASVTTV